jgi:hypothetical protein
VTRCIKVMLSLSGCMGSDVVFQCNPSLSVELLLSLDSKLNKLLLSYANHQELMSSADGPLDVWRRNKLSSDRNQLMELYVRCHGWLVTNGQAPPNLYNPETHKKFMGFQLRAQKNSNEWIRKRPSLRGVELEPYYPAVAFKDDGNVVGFEYLFFKFSSKFLNECKMREGECDDCPALCEDGEAYYTFYAHTSMALLMKGFNAFPSSIRNLHIICKGFREFNVDGKVPRRVNGRDMPWYMHTHNAPNLKQFVSSVMECDAFTRAANKPAGGQPLRRIVVWLLEVGHFESFCWGQRYDSRGRVIGNIMYIVSTVEGKNLWGAPDMHEMVVEEFKRALIGQHNVTVANTRTIPDLNMRAMFRESVLYADDLWCVLITGFSVFLLSNVVDIENWKGDGIPREFWEFCRSGYSKFDKGLISTLDSLLSSNSTVWACPALQAKHLNIKDVHLLTIDNTTGLKRKLEYDWNLGWMLTAL